MRQHANYFILKKWNVNKPEAPQSPQISICARDLMRDIT